MRNKHCCVLYTKVVKRANHKSPLHKEKIFFLSLLYFLSIWDNGCSLNLLWSSFHEVCKPNHYAVYLQLKQCCMLIMSQQNGRKKFRNKYLLSNEKKLC